MTPVGLDLNPRAGTSENQNRWGVSLNPSQVLFHGMLATGRGEYAAQQKTAITRNSLSAYFPSP